MKQYLLNILIALDQLLNTLIGGWPDETMSSWAYRVHRDGKPWGFLAPVIDAIFFWQPSHCAQSYLSEKLKKQLPPEER